MAEPWALYAGIRDRFIDLLRSLDGEQAARLVPACPDWTVAGVAAHVCGLNADIAAGRREHLGTPERTGLNVELRAGSSLDEICDEWIGYEETMSEVMAEDPYFGQRLAADLVVHLHDVQLALNLPVDRDDEATLAAVRMYADRVGAGIADDLDGEMVVDFGEGLTLRTTPYDFLRSVTGRRSRGQVESLEWAGDPTALLDAGLSPYGPFPAEDLEI